MTREFKRWPLSFYKFIHLFILAIPSKFQWNKPFKSGVTVEKWNFQPFSVTFYFKIWPLTPIAFLFLFVIPFLPFLPSCISFWHYSMKLCLKFTYFKNLTIDIWPSSLTVDLPVWHLTHITPLLCWSLNNDHSCRISLQLHTFFWRYGWNTIFLAKVHWPLTFKSDLLPWSPSENMCPLNVHVSSKLQCNRTIISNVVKEFVCVLVIFPQNGPRITIWHHEQELCFYGNDQACCFHTINLKSEDIVVYKTNPF